LKPSPSEWPHDSFKNDVRILDEPAPAPELRRHQLAESGGAREVTVSLEDMTVRCGDACFSFEAPPVLRSMLMQGVDEIELTKVKMPVIDAFRAADRSLRPWAYRTVS
jgi:3-isopropylmalate/(R)-2-methylmalate dehydratase small subunit